MKRVLIRILCIGWLMHRRMCPKNTNSIFLRVSAARAPQDIQYEWNAKGYGLEIFDAYRPYSIKVNFGELIKDPRYVAEPTKGSGQIRGLAVDCTLLNLTDAKELDMGTGSDTPDPATGNTRYRIFPSGNRDGNNTTIYRSQSQHRY